RLRRVPRAGARDRRVGADHRAGPRRPARGALDRRRPQVRAATPPRALDLDRGAHPTLHASHGGLPGAAGRRARLLRRRRRLGQAGPRALPRPLVREPAGAPRHVRGRLRRRPDPEPGHARPDPGRHRPVTELPEIRPTDELSASEREALIASMRPEDAERVPELHEVDVPPELRREIEEAMSRYPQIRSAAIPALWAVQRRYGWCTPDGIRQAA